MAAADTNKEDSAATSGVDGVNLRIRGKHWTVSIDDIILFEGKSGLRKATTYQLVFNAIVKEDTWLDSAAIFRFLSFCGIIPFPTKLVGKPKKNAKT